MLTSQHSDTICSNKITGKTDFIFSIVGYVLLRVCTHTGSRMQSRHTRTRIRRVTSLLHQYSGQTVPVFNTPTAIFRGSTPSTQNGGAVRTMSGEDSFQPKVSLIVLFGH